VLFAHRVNAVANPAYGFQKILPAPFIYFFPQMIDMDVHDIAERIKVKIPHIKEDIVPRHYLVRMAHQIFQDAELFKSELNLLSV